MLSTVRKYGAYSSSAIRSSSWWSWRVDVVRHAVRIALLRAFPGQLLQGLLRGQAGEAHLVRILVAQFVEREAAAFGDLLRAGDGVRMAGRTAAPFPSAVSGGDRRSARGGSRHRRWCSLRGCRSARPAGCGAAARDTARRRWRRWGRVPAARGRRSVAGGPRRWGGGAGSGRHRRGRRSRLSGAEGFRGVGGVQRMAIRPSPCAARSSQSGRTRLCRRGSCRW